MMEGAGVSLPNGHSNLVQLPSNPKSPVHDRPRPANNTGLDNKVADNTNDAEDMETLLSPDEVDESLIELSMSHVASRMKDPKTPAMEKAMVMEDGDGGGQFDSDPDTPPADQSELAIGENDSTDTLRNENGIPLQSEDENPPQPASDEARLSPEIPPAQTHEAPPVLPSPRKASPQPIRAEKPELNLPAAGASSLTGVFSNRTRSRSGGAEALKKLLPKGVGNFLGHSSTVLSGEPRSKRSSGIISSQNTSRTQSPERDVYQSFDTHTAVNTQKEAPLDANRTPTIRRVTSDDSLLYHSLSRTSSLGDDSRFESQKEQVNSRAKAIRDSMQDRSSFRLPSLPTMPSMPSMPRVSNFNFNMNFLNGTQSTVSNRRRPMSDLNTVILAGNTNEDRPIHLPSAAVASGLIGVAASQPRAAIVAKPVAEGQLPSSLERAMEALTGDIVIMGGYRGSILRDTKTKRQVWVPVKVGLNMRKVNLEVGLEPEDEERMEETIYPSGMLQNIGPVDISRRLIKRLSECENAKNGKLRVWDYGYDWRLSPHLLARKLTTFLESLPSNQPPKDGSVQGHSGAVVIAHSLGGLITRHVVNNRPELFSGVVYAGVPQACVNILGALRNGDAVLLSQRVLTAQVNFTLRTSFVLLPEDGGCFVDINTKEKYPVDFFNVDDWIKYRWSPCTDPPLPPKNPSTQGGLGGLLNKSSTLLSLPASVKAFGSGPSSPNTSSFPSPSLQPSTALSTEQSMKSSRAADIGATHESAIDRTLPLQMGNMGSNSNPVSKGHSTNSSISTLVTIPRSKAIAYLARTLSETKTFKQQLQHRPSITSSNRYPPLALIYGKHIPTCSGAKVDGVDGIPCSDSYDNLAFGSGDGVVLAKEAMLPPGYNCVNGGRISSDRGHVTLLGDLNAVGRALEAVLRGRRKGIGMGMPNGD